MAVRDLALAGGPELSNSGESCSLSALVFIGKRGAGAEIAAEFVSSSVPAFPSSSAEQVRRTARSARLRSVLLILASPLRI